MSVLLYISGEEIKDGDSIRYHGESGRVEFIAMHRSADQARNWYVDQFPGGGVMINAGGFGFVFVAAAEIDDQLELVSRAEPSERNL